MAELFCTTLFRYRDEDKLLVHAFVVMPNHIHLLLSVPVGLTLERVMQFVKGGFSHEASILFGIRPPLWQKSFVDRRVRDAEECAKFVKYIHQNPVKAGLVDSASAYRYSSFNPLYWPDELPQRLKPVCSESGLLHR
jgi:putative transposase